MFDSSLIIPLIACVFALGGLIIAIISFVKVSAIERAARGTDIHARLVDIIKENDQLKKHSDDIDAHIAELSRVQKFAVQSIGTERFDAFAGAGGKQSVAVTCLDAHKCGFILTVWNARERTNIFVRLVRNGQPEVELSEPEMKSLETAMRGLSR